MKENIIAVVGHIDHGKSTLLGRLLYDTNNIADAEITNRKNKGDEFAHLIDIFAEEQTKSRTINARRIYMKIDGEEYTFFDVPGHVEFIESMVTSSAKVKSAIVVIDVEEGVRRQTKKHLNILTLFGVRRVIVVINKMDKTDCEKEAFDKIAQQIAQICVDNDVAIEEIIPISAQSGWNIVKNNNKCKWYKGKTLIESIKLLQNNKSSYGASDAIIAVQDVYKFDNKECIVAKLVSGKVAVKNTPPKLYNATTRKYCELQGIKNTVNNRKYIIAGDVISMEFKKRHLVNRGDILFEHKQGVRLSKKLEGQLLWVSNDAIDNTKVYFFSLSTQKTVCKITLKINKELQTKNIRGEIFNDVQILLDKKVIWERFKKNNTLGLFTISTKRKVVAVGIL